jgi:hypothetical protein
MNNQNQVQMKKFSSLFALFIVFSGLAQNYTGTITNVKENGLHQILIAPEVRAVANENLSYFRIFDQNKTEISYVIDNFKTESSKYNAFKIIAKKTIADSITSITIQNETGKKINQFNLNIANTALTKTYSISGSNDQLEWFGLVSNEILSDLVAQKGTALEKIIYFPANEYKYLRINFNDKKSLPINVKAIGIYENQFLTEKLVEITGYTYSVIEDKKNKRTKISFIAEHNYLIDAITFSISTQFYAREAKINVKRAQKVKKRVDFYEDVVGFFQLNSKYDKTIYVNGLHEKEFIIEIENQDNQPLTITNIQLFQKPIAIISSLKANENYEVIVDSTLTKPSYDLANFISEATLNLPKATISNFKKSEKEILQQTEKSFFQTQLFMWICIIVAAVLIGFFAFGLLKDMKEE